MKRVVVLGLMGQYPLGGMAWQVLHHVEGLRRLGCDVTYVENSGAPPYSPRQQSLGHDARENVRFLRDTFRRFDLGDRWAYFDSLSGRWHGDAARDVDGLLAAADAIVNLCAASLPAAVERRSGCLVYLETDPIREQIKLANGDEKSRAFVGAHDVHFSYGWNIGTPACPVPDGGIAWRKTHPPVIVDWWQASPPRARAPWRTIATYRNEGKDVVLDGRVYRWSKEPSFERVMDLPERTRETLELALVAPNEDVWNRFVANGWHVRPAYDVSCGAARYRRFICGAKGELSVEKDDQVRLRSGWFSDRSVCFLAAGRPCVLQDTGFGTRLPLGEGLFAWSTPDEAAAALDQVASDLQWHSVRAREIACEHFEATRLLAPILAAAGCR